MGAHIKRWEPSPGVLGGSTVQSPTFSVLFFTPNPFVSMLR